MWCANLTRAARALLAAVLFQVACLAAYAVYVGRLAYFAMDSPEPTPWLFYYSACLGFVALFQVTVTFDALLTENTAELNLALGISLGVIAIVAYVFINSALGIGSTFVRNNLSTSIGTSRAPLKLVLALMLVTAVVIAVCGFKTWRNFGWRVFKLFGTNTKMRKLYTELLQARALMKLDGMVTACAIAQSWQMMFRPAQELPLVILYATFVGACVLVHGLAWLAVRRELQLLVACLARSRSSSPPSSSASPSICSTTSSAAARPTRSARRATPPSVGQHGDGVRQRLACGRGPTRRTASSARSPAAAPASVEAGELEPGVYEIQVYDLAVRREGRQVGVVERCRSRSSSASYGLYATSIAVARRFGSGLKVVPAVGARRRLQDAAAADHAAERPRRPLALVDAPRPTSASPPARCASARRRSPTRSPSPAAAPPTRTSSRSAARA